MYLLRVGITVYKHREFERFVAVSYFTDGDTVQFVTIEGEPLVYYLTDIHKLKVTAFKSIKPIGD